MDSKIEPNFKCTKKHRAFIRDFFDDNKGRSLKEAIACWKYKRSLPGHNKYEREGLKILSI